MVTNECACFVTRPGLGNLRVQAKQNEVMVEIQCCPVPGEGYFRVNGNGVLRLEILIPSHLMWIVNESGNLSYDGTTSPLACTVSVSRVWIPFSL